MVAHCRSCGSAQCQKSDTRAVYSSFIATRQNLSLDGLFWTCAGDAEVNVNLLHLDDHLPCTPLAPNSQSRHRPKKTVKYNLSDDLAESALRWSAGENTDTSFCQLFRCINQAS